MAGIAKNKILLIIVAVLLLTNIGMLVFLLKMKPGGSHGRGPGGWQGTTEFLEKKVGFSQQQLKAYQELRAHHREKMKPLLTDMRTAKESFYRLLYNPGLTESLLHQSADSIGRRQSAIDLQTFRHFQQVRGLCDPEQRQRFDSLVHQVIYKMTGGRWEKAKRVYGP